MTDAAVGAPPVLELETASMAAGGEAVARDDGRVVFVRGALPGERVRARLVEERRSFARADLVEVVRASPDRRNPPCPHVADGCGGCDWQHADPAAQVELRRTIVRDALTRIGRLVDPVVEVGPPLPSEGYRTTVRCTVVGGRAGYRRRASHEGLAVDRCLVAHPLVDELIVEGRFGSAAEVTLRAGAATGERLVLAHPTAQGVVVPPGVIVVGADELAAGRQAWFHEVVAGRTWRVSASSFFQASPAGAEGLVAAVGDLVAAHAPEARSLVDLCAGVGLFAGTVGAGRSVEAVERHGPAVADLQANLADDATVVGGSFESWSPSPGRGRRPFDVVVADPARRGLAKAGVAAVARAGAGLVVLVSCDPAALGRDAGLLLDAGYSHIGSRLVDLFPNTSHVETVSGFRR